MATATAVIVTVATAVKDEADTTSAGGFDRKPRQEGGFSRPNRGGNLRKRRED